MSAPAKEFRRVLPFLRPYQWRIVGVFLLGILASSLGLVQPWLSKMLIDRGLLARDLSMLAWCAGGMAIAAVLAMALNAMSSLAYVSLSAAMLFDMRRALFEHLQRLSPRFFARQRLGDIVSRLNGDIGEVQRAAADVPMAILTNAVFLAGSVALMLSLNPKLFVAGVSVVPIAVWFARQMQTRLGDQSRELRERSASVGSFLIESLQALRLVVAVARERHESGRFAGENARYVESLMQLQRTSMWLGAVPGTLMTLATAGVFLYGGRLIFDGELTLGGLVAFMAYHSRMLSPVQNLLSLASTVSVAKASLHRVFELFDTVPDVVESQAPRLPASNAGHVRFHDVSVSQNGVPVLAAASFEVAPGTLCVIAGPSGAGKSTLGDLLVRFLDPDSGTIEVDGVDLREWPLARLREHVALADQSPVLFHGTVRENLRYASPGATEADLEDVAKDLDITGLLHRASTGERGTALSAGERQRIAIAQTLLRPARVFVFDEPTAALDPKNETRLVATIRKRLAGRTVIVITHREALIAQADQAITIGGGIAVASARTMA